jgi:dUTP pyrophosphatase
MLLQRFTGLDSLSAADLVVPSRGKALVPTDLSIAIPPGHYARVGAHSRARVLHGLC